MNEFDDIESLKVAFASGRVGLGQSIVVNGVDYQYKNSSQHSILDMLQEGYKGIVLYTVRPQEDNVAQAKRAGLQEWLVLIWTAGAGLRLEPTTVRTDTKARILGAGPRLRQVLRPATESFKEIDQSRIIPDIVKVMIVDVPVGNELTGKVDTGADICSLHATNINVDRGNDSVSFVCPELSNNTIRMPLAGQQAVRNSSGTEYRPVVSLNIKVGDRMMKDIKVNLNDRSDMSEPFLLGQNALEAGKFIIDPNIIKENVEPSEDDVFEMLQEVYKHEEFSAPLVDNQRYAEILTALGECDIPVSDLVKALRTETLKRL